MLHATTIRSEAHLLCGNCCWRGAQTETQTQTQNVLPNFGRKSAETLFGATCENCKSCLKLAKYVPQMISSTVIAKSIERDGHTLSLSPLLFLRGSPSCNSMFHSQQLKLAA